MCFEASDLLALSYNSVKDVFRYLHCDALLALAGYHYHSQALAVHGMVVHALVALVMEGFDISIFNIRTYN